MKPISIASITLLLAYAGWADDFISARNGDWRNSNGGGPQTWNIAGFPGINDNATVLHTVGVAQANSCARLFLSGHLQISSVQLIVNNGLEWSDGSISGSANLDLFGSSLFRTGSVKTMSGGGMVNNGTILLQEGFWRCNSSPIFANLVNAQLNLHDAVIDTTGGGGLHVQNSGFITKTAGSGTATVNFQSLTTTGGGIASNSGTLVVNSPTVVSDNSRWDAVNGVLDITGTGSTSIKGILLGNSPGLVNFGGNWVVHPDNVELNFIAGSGFTWSSGSMTNNQITNRGILSLTTSTVKSMNSLHIINGGAATMRHQGGWLRMNSGSKLTNTLNGTFDIMGDVAIDTTGGVGPIIDNFGFFRKIAGSGTASIVASVFNNSGTISVEAGTLSLNVSTVTSASTWGIFGSASIALVGSFGGTKWEGIYTGNGAGPMVLNANPSIGPAGVQLNMTNAGFVWESGSINGNQLTNGGRIRMTTGSVKSLNSVSVVNNGNAALEAGWLRMNSGAQWTNAATGLLELFSGATIDYTGGAASTILNQGLIRKTGAGTSTISNPNFDNRNTVEVQGGILNLNSTNVNAQAGNTWDIASGARVVLLSGMNLQGEFAGPSTGTLEFSSLALNPNGLTLNLGGPAEWTTGTVSNGPVTSNQVVLATTGSVKTLSNATFDNNFLFRLAGGFLRLNSGSVFNNNASFEVAGNFAIDYTGGAQTRFNNFGSFEKTSGVGAATVSVPAFDNSGIVQVELGQLNVNSGTILSSGVWQAEADTSISITGGAGTLFEGLFEGIGSGRFVFAGLNIGPNGATLDFSNGGAEWVSGTIFGNSLNNDDLLRLTTGAVKTISAITLNNRGQCFFDGGFLRINSGGIFDNHPGATFDITGDIAIDYTGGAQTTFLNRGTMKKSGGSGTAMISVPTFENRSAVRAESGTLRSVSGTIRSVAGSWFTAPGTVLSFVGGGTTSFEGAFNGSGTGQARMSSLNMTGAGASLSFPSGMFWEGGTLTGSQLINNGHFETATTSIKSMSGHSIVNNGTMLHAEGFVRLNSASSITNSPDAEFEVRDSTTFDSTGGAPSSINNNGNFRKIAGAGTTTLTHGVFNNAMLVESRSGTINFGSPYIQTTGETWLNGGNLQFGSPMGLQGGRLHGNGIVTGSIANSGGSVEPGGPLDIGQINVTANYTQSGTGSVQIQVKSLTEFDKLVVGNIVNLGGELDIELVDGFIPPLGSSYDIITATTRNGGFSIINSPIFSGGQSLRPQYLSNRVRLVVMFVGDVNGDDCVDDVDLAMVLAAFGNTCIGCPEDLNADGIVDDVDLALVLVSFGLGC